MTTKYFGDDITLTFRLNYADGTPVPISSLTSLRLLVFDMKSPNKRVSQFAYPDSEGYDSVTVVDGPNGIVNAKIGSGEIAVGEYGVEIQFLKTEGSVKSGCRADKVFEVKNLKLGNV